MRDMKETRQLFSHDTALWQPIRDEGTIDMRFVSGDPWTDIERGLRAKAGRPCLSADELGQYLNQVVNKVRSNKIGVKFTPIGNGADDKTAEFYQNKMREIEYRSRAQIAYTTAFENCVQRSYGFVRVSARYLSPTSVNQDLFIDPVHNPNLITPDAAAVIPDLSDQDHCWVREKWPIAEFNRKWKKYSLSEGQLGRYATDAPGWVTADGVFVGEFWKVSTTTRKLLVVQPASGGDPVGIWEDDYTLDLGEVVSERDSEDRSVSKQLINGLEVLEETDWPGRYIPIVGCLGKVVYVDTMGVDRRQVLSMTRLGRDPQKMCAYLDTAEAELIGMTPKFPYFVYEGQLSPLELANLAKSNMEPVAVIQVKPSIQGLPPGNGPLPFPQRNPFDPAIQPLEIARESWRRKVQAAVAGSPLPTSAQRRNEKSGVALKVIEDLGEIGSYHFKDSYLGMLGMVGVICEDLITSVYDTPRDVAVRLQDDTSAMVRINDDEVEGSVSTQGDHLVTVSTGPSFDSEREAGTNFADTFVTSPMLPMVGPEKGLKLLAQAIKLKNLGPIGDEMVKIIDPEPPADGEAPSPEQLQQMVQQAQAQLQQAGQMVQQLQQEAATEGAKQRATMAKAQLDAETDLKKAAMEYDRDLKLQAMRDRNALAVAILKLRAASALQDDQQAHETGLEAASAAHEIEVAAQDAEQALQMAQMGHAQDLESGERKVAGQSTLAAQAHQQAIAQQSAAPAGGE